MKNEKKTVSQNSFVVLALDGVPFGLLKELFAAGAMPHLARMAEQGTLKKMRSVQPPLSSSAWASFLTGAQPGEHGILGFTERDPQTMDWFTPDARHLKMPALPYLLSDRGQRVFSMNVPLTSPPRPLNGICIGGFLATSLEQAVYPPQLAGLLRQKDYRIDADVSLAKSDFRAFIRNLEETLERRLAMMHYFYERGPWDFFMTHIMETDRLHHFTYEWWEEGRPAIRAYYEKFYRRIDGAIGRLLEKIPHPARLLLLSDHGFTTLKKEVYLNRWLWEKGYLQFTHPRPQNLGHIHPQSRAYSLYPGRIFINLRGREKNGCVTPGLAYEQIRNEIRDALMEMRDPENGSRVISRALNGETVYGGAGRTHNPLQSRYADVLALPQKGYELKGLLWHKQLFDKTVYNGMHSFDDAFFLSGHKINPDKITAISDVFDFIMSET